MITMADEAILYLGLFTIFLAVALFGETLSKIFNWE